MCFGIPFFPENFTQVLSDDWQLLRSVASRGSSVIDEKVKEAAKRAFCALGMALGALVFVGMLLKIISFSFECAFFLTLGVALYAISHEVFSRSCGNKKTGLATAIKHHTVQSIGKYAAKSPEIMKAVAEAQALAKAEELAKQQNAAKEKAEQKKVGLPQTNREQPKVIEVVT